MAFHRFIMQEVTHRIKDRAIVDCKTGSYRGYTDRLTEVAFTGPRWSQPKNIAFVANEVAGRQIKDPILLDRGVK